MAAPSSKILFPRRSVLYLVFTISGVVLFVLAGIWPNHIKIQKLTLEQQAQAAQLHEKQELLPLRLQLEGLLHKDAAQYLPAPTLSGYPRRQADRLTGELAALAAAHNLNTVSATLDLGTLTRDTGTLLIYLTLRGTFLELRPFLLSLHEWAHFEHLEKIGIRQDPVKLTFDLRLWVRTTTQG